MSQWLSYITWCAYTASQCVHILSIEQPNNDMPSCRITRLYFYISMKRNPTRSAFVYGYLNYMELTKASMCEWYVFLRSCKARSCSVTQSHAKLRKVMQRPPQGHATSCKVMQSYVIMQSKSCKASHTAFSVSFTLLSRRFACIQAFSGGCERWLSTTGGLRNLSWSHLWCFVRKQSFIRWTLRKSNFPQSRSISERERGWSTDSD